MIVRGLTPKPKLQPATIRGDGGRNLKHKYYFFVTSTLRLAAMLDGPYLCPSTLLPHIHVGSITARAIFLGRTLLQSHKRMNQYLTFLHSSS